MTEKISPKIPKERILVWSNHTGGAELISSLIKHNQAAYNWRIILKRPIIANVFKKKGLKKMIDRRQNLKIAKIFEQKPDYVFLTTGWQADNNKIIEYCRKTQTPSVAFLDHWIDYRERFGYPTQNWKINLPDLVAVSDKNAYFLAKNLGFPKLAKINNYYLLDIIKRLKDKNKNQIENLLFLSQTMPVVKKNRNFKYHGDFENKIITDILKNWPLVSKNAGIKKLLIRLHPEQNPEDLPPYQKMFPDVEIEFENSNIIPLEKSLKEAKLVTGLNSMALYISFLVGKPTKRAFLPQF